MKLIQPQAEVTAAVKKIIIGSIIAEYGARELQDGTYQEMKQRVNKVIHASMGLQSHFLHSPHTTPEYREVFRKEFIKSEIYLISEIVQAVYGLNETDLEMILNAIKKNTKECKDATYPAL